MDLATELDRDVAVANALSDCEAAPPPSREFVHRWIEGLERRGFVIIPDPRPPTRSEPIVVQGQVVGTRVTHDGPCVWTVGRCSCGTLGLGIVRG